MTTTSRLTLGLDQEEPSLLCIRIPSKTFWLRLVTRCPDFLWHTIFANSLLYFFPRWITGGWEKVHSSVSSWRKWKSLSTSIWASAQHQSGIFYLPLNPLISKNNLNWAGSIRWYPYNKLIMCWWWWWCMVCLAQVDVENPDVVQFPDFLNASYQECVLEPGDVLFIPKQHWHYVRSLELSFSVSFWWSWY